MKLAREASAALKLEGDEARYVSQIFERFAQRIAQIPGPERIELARGVQSELKGVLGANRWQAFERFQAAWLEQQQGF
jgi:hypothetical protein